MAKLEQMRSQLSSIGEIQVQADGYALWLLWHGGANPVVMQTLEDYGGIKIAENDDQALCFFFSLDVLLAAARLGVWARFNPLALGLQIFPARLQAGRDGAKNLIVDESLWQQAVPPPLEYRVWVHASMREAVEASPGLSLVATAKEDGLDTALWQSLEVDARLPYQSPLSWYTILRPVGNPLDKQFMHGWREFFSQLEALLQRNKFRFSVYDHTLVFPLEGLRQVRNWCRDYLQLLEKLKTDSPHQYWPCVMAVVDRKGLSLNEDLPDKVDVAWEHLIPDYPHMSMRNALMLGDEFVAHEVRFAPVRRHPDDWASVSLKSGEQSSGAMPQLAPVNLIFGPHEPCFYCGQRSHAARDCPSRSIDPQTPSVWQKVARLDLRQMREAADGIDKRLSAVEGEEAKLAAVAEILREDGPEADMARAYYDILWPVQLRAVNFFWRARDKDLQKAAKKLAPMDDNPLWEALRTLPGKEDELVEQEMKNLALKYGKDYRFQSLSGFLAAEKGDLARAEKYWKEAEMASPHPVVQSWHMLLQARCLESEGRYAQASTLYDQISRACPAWFDAEYRRAVCLIKSGFSEQALQGISSLIDRSGHFFNRALIDPELERGFIQVLAALYKLWFVMEERARDEVVNLTRMRGELGTWFLPDNPFALEVAERIEKVLAIASVHNYVAFQLLMTGRMRIEKDIQAYVMREAKSYKNTFRSFGLRLKDIHEESAWFPFPKVLVEFNRSFNEGVANVNWAMTANFHSPESFKKAQAFAEQEEKRIKKLEGRLRFLRIVRDSTLFVLSMAETFFWLELVACILIFAVLPLFLYYGDRLGFDFAVEAFKQERWQVQKALIIFVSALVLAIASLRTILRFETIRDKILAKARDSVVKPKNAGPAAAKGKRR